MRDAHLCAPFHADCISTWMNECTQGYRSCWLVSGRPHPNMYLCCVLAETRRWCCVVRRWWSSACMGRALVRAKRVNDFDDVHESIGLVNLKPHYCVHNWTPAKDKRSCTGLVWHAATLGIDSLIARNTHSTYAIVNKYIIIYTYPIHTPKTPRIFFTLQNKKELKGRSNGEVNTWA